MADRVDAPGYASYTTAAAVPTVRLVSWGAIFAGAIVATVLQMMLGLLGLSIGLAVTDPMEMQGGDAWGMGIGSYIWWICSGIISLFIGGWAAARLAAVPRRLIGALHGLVVWALATLFLAYLLTTTVGNIMGGAFNVLDDSMTSAGQAQSTGQTGQSGQAATGGLAQRAEQEMQEMQEGGQLQRTAQQASDWTAGAAFWAFFMMIVGAAAGLTGGAMGARGPMGVNDTRAERTTHATRTRP